MGGGTAARTRECQRRRAGMEEESEPGLDPSCGMEGCDRAPKVGQERVGLQSGRNGSYSASPFLSTALTCLQHPAALPPQLTTFKTFLSLPGRSETSQERYRQAPPLYPAAPPHWWRGPFPLVNRVSPSTRLHPLRVLGIRNW